MYCFVSVVDSNGGTQFPLDPAPSAVPWKRQPGESTSSLQPLLGKQNGIKKSKWRRGPQVSTKMIIQIRFTFMLLWLYLFYLFISVLLRWATCSSQLINHTSVLMQLSIDTDWGNLRWTLKYFMLSPRNDVINQQPLIKLNLLLRKNFFAWSYIVSGMNYSYCHIYAIAMQGKNLKDVVIR